MPFADDRPAGPPSRSPGPDGLLVPGPRSAAPSGEGAVPAGGPGSASCGQGVPATAAPFVPGPGTGDQPGVPVADARLFTVRLPNFEGPFDLLLRLISKHTMDITEVALSQVTDEFMTYIRAMGPEWDLDRTTEFLVVAATLLDLKAARLLPAAELEDEEDLALLEARDLLFARLLQYRAYKRVAEVFAGRLEAEELGRPRAVALEARFAALRPDVVLGVGPEDLARLAVAAIRPRPGPQVSVEHLYAPLVSVREQTEVVIARLRELGEADFRDLTAGAADTLTVVARFLALLELYRERMVVLDQEEALGALWVRWTGGTRPPAVGRTRSDHPGTEEYAEDGARDE